jgi:hypothetical protein
VKKDAVESMFQDRSFMEGGDVNGQAKSTSSECSNTRKK